MQRLLFLVTIGIAVPPLAVAQDTSPAMHDYFWRWFQRNNDALLAVRTAREPVCDTLAAELRKIHPDLVFEFGPADARPREFVVSADGLKDAFPAVNALVDAAPTMEDWRVIRFRPRRTPMDLQMYGLRLTPADFAVLLEADGEKVGLVVSVAGFHPTENKAYEHLGYLMLDQALGEVTMETRIGFIEFVAAANRPTGTWYSLAELPSVVDAWPQR